MEKNIEQILIDSKNKLNEAHLTILELKAVIKEKEEEIENLEKDYLLNKAVAENIIADYLKKIDNIADAMDVNEKWTFELIEAEKSRIKKPFISRRNAIDRFDALASALIVEYKRNIESHGIIRR